MADNSAAKTSKAAAKAAETIDEQVEVATTQAEVFIKQFELPEPVRALAERGIEQTRESYGQMRNAARSATELLEDSASKVNETATTYNLKTVEFAQANTEAGFDFTRKLFATSDMSKLVELQLAFASKQAETFSAQFNELSAFATKAVKDSNEPFMAQISKSVEKFGTGFSR